MSACESLSRLIERKQLLFLMPREDWGGKKRSREKGGGRKEIRVLRERQRGKAGRKLGRKEEQAGSELSLSEINRL